MRYPSLQSFHRLVFKAGSVRTSIQREGNDTVFACAMPWLAGPRTHILAHGDHWQCVGDDWLLSTDDGLAGILTSAIDGPLDRQAEVLYQKLFALTDGLNLHRIWNFVPLINAIGGGVENYVAFNAGRHRGFQNHFGTDCLSRLPAASALGTQSGPLALVFTAGTTRVENFENPLQVPAPEYPARYGKNPPLFARGSRIDGHDGPHWHLSGTASIRGSETIGSSLAEQIAVTLENIQTVLDFMHVPESAKAVWKVFLRRPADLTECRRLLAKLAPAGLKQAMFLHADICRSDLLLEIEGIYELAAQSSARIPYRLSCQP